MSLIQNVASKDGELGKEWRVVRRWMTVTFIPPSHPNFRDWAKNEWRRYFTSEHQAHKAGAWSVERHPGWSWYVEDVLLLSANGGKTGYALSPTARRIQTTARHKRRK